MKPALLTGTSSEFLGKKPLPRLLRERFVIFVLGPEGSGKTSVSLRLAGGGMTYKDTQQTQELILERVKNGAFPEAVLLPRALVLDGPVWLGGRPGQVDVLAELLARRAAHGKMTLVCQSDTDGSIQEVIARMEPGTSATIGLRFPKGERGRRAFARRACDQLGVPRSAARGTANLEPWGYARVTEELKKAHLEPDSQAP